MLRARLVGSISLDTAILVLLLDVLLRVFDFALGGGNNNKQFSTMHVFSFAPLLAQRTWKNLLATGQKLFF